MTKKERRVISAREMEKLRGEPVSDLQYLCEVFHETAMTVWNVDSKHDAGRKGPRIG